MEIKPYSKNSQIDWAQYQNANVVFDIESNNREGIPTTRPVLMQFRKQGEDNWSYIDVRDAEPGVIENFKQSYQTWNLIGHNLQFDIGVIYSQMGIMPNRVKCDTYVLARMLQEPNQALKDLGEKYCGITRSTFDFPEVNGEIQYDFSREDLLYYIYLDTLIPELLMNYYKKTSHIYQYMQSMAKAINLEMQLIPLVAKMQVDGLNIDMNLYQEIIQEATQEVAEKQAKLDEMAGHSVRVTSNADVQKLLFEEQRLVPRLMSPKTGAPSVSQEALAYHEGNPFVDLITTLKSDKAVLSSLNKLPETLVNSKVHPEFKVIGYDGTGRIYTDPSVNQWPKIARKLIKADPGNKFVYFDLSSAEMVVALYMAGEVEPLELYNNGGDLHRFVAGRLYDKPADSISKEEREAAKVVEFSILYGSEGQAAARKLRISDDEGHFLVSKFFTMFPRMKAKTEEMIMNTEFTGATSTMIGRKRKFETKWGVSKKVARQSVNTAVQSSVADFQKMIMLRLDAKGIRVKFTVFDSFLIEVPENLANESYLKPILDEVTNFSSMFDGLKFNYSLGVGDSFYDAYKNA